MKDVNIKVDFNQKRICNNVVVGGGFMQLDENAIKIAIEKDGEHKLNPQTFIVWQALCITYFKEEQRAITKNLGLSTKHIADSYGFNKRVVQRAIEELVEKGWLINVRDELWMLVVPGTVAAEKKAEQVDDKEHVYWEYTGGISETLTQSIIEEEQQVEEDCSCQNNNHEEGLVVETTTTSCQNNITNITNNTFNNITVDDDDSCSTVNYDGIEVAPQSTSSCSTAHTNITNNTFNNITVEATEENNNVVAPESTTASSIDNAASEDAEASSGMSEQELRDYFKSQGDIRKVFVKDTLKPWLKYGDGYTSNLTCLELWWRVKDNYEDLGKGSLKCDHQSLAATYTLWNRAIVAKDKD